MLDLDTEIAMNRFWSLGTLASMLSLLMISSRSMAQDLGLDDQDYPSWRKIDQAMDFYRLSLRI